MIAGVTLSVQMRTVTSNSSRNSARRNPQFALTWNWPAFLFISFLWFLYRKMYLYAAVYAIGPMVSTYLTGT